MTRFLKIQGIVFAFLTLCVVLGWSQVQTVSDQTQVIIASILILFLGVPHGALDAVLAEKSFNIKGYLNWALFLVQYCLLAALIVVIAFYLPLVFLVGFLVISVFHFSTDLTPNVPFVSRLLYGGAIIFVSAVYYSDEMVRLFGLLSGPDVAETIIYPIKSVAVPWLVLLVGAAQLKMLNQTGSLLKLIDMIEADALIIHLNPLQEVLQPGGDKDWSGVLNQIDIAVRSLATPVIVKEVGFGISARVAKQLWNVGVKIIDVAGSGGTSWAAVEAARAPSDLTREVAETFRDWGISTAQSIRMIDDLQCGIQIIASGGLRTGLEAAQALRLGASLAGFAAQLLPAAVEGAESLNAAISKLMTELRIAAFCTGSASITELKRAAIL